MGHTVERYIGALLVSLVGGGITVAFFARAMGWMRRDAWSHGSAVPTTWKLHSPIFLLISLAFLASTIFGYVLLLPSSGEQVFGVLPIALVLLTAYVFMPPPGAPQDDEKSK